MGKSSKHFSWSLVQWWDDKRHRAIRANEAIKLAHHHSTCAHCMGVCERSAPFSAGMQIPVNCLSLSRIDFRLRPPRGR